MIYYRNWLSSIPSFQRPILTVLLIYLYGMEPLYGSILLPSQTPSLFKYSEPPYNYETNQYQGRICVNETTRYEPTCSSSYDGNLNIGLISLSTMTEPPKWDYPIVVVNTKTFILSMPTREELKERGNCIHLNLSMPLSDPLPEIISTWICYCEEDEMNICLPESWFNPNTVRHATPGPASITPPPSPNIVRKSVSASLENKALSAQPQKSVTPKNVMHQNSMKCLAGSVTSSLGTVRSVAECSYRCFQLKSKEQCTGIYWTSDGRCEAVFKIYKTLTVYDDCQYWRRIG